MGERKPVKVSVVMQMDPMSCYADDLDALAHQFAGWVVNNVTKMTERMGGDLFVAVVTTCEGQRGSMSYRDGQFVKDANPASDDPEEVAGQ